jgi:lysophospholipase L1-like esterase
MKTVLCFGDSNTWGYDPDASSGAPFPRRHPPETRWTGVLARELGADWRVVEEGQNGRTTVFVDPFNPYRVGRDYLPAALESHKPLDVVVLMLGTNDLKAVNAAPASQIAEGVAVLAKMILASDAGPEARPPKLLLMAPPAIGDVTGLPDGEEKFAGADAKSRRLPELYRRHARFLRCGFVNAQEFTQPSPADGVHLDAANHLALGRAVAGAVADLAK